jgi:universal stress protein A
MLTWLKILCAVDFSRSSHDALEHAADLAMRFGAELTLIHVLEVEQVAGSEIVLPRERAETERHARERELEAWKAEAERISGRGVHAVVASGFAPLEILRMATAEGFDLIVTGTHGRGLIGRILLGSVAERVAREAPCAVLVARSAKDWGD